MAFIVEEREDKTIPEDFVVQAVCREVGVRSFTSQAGKEYKKVEFWFEVVGPEKYAGRKVKGECWPELTNEPGNQFRMWIEALIGMELGVGQAVDEDDLVGLPCDLTVTHSEPSKKDGRIFENVDMVMEPTKGTQGKRTLTEHGDDVPFDAGRQGS